jgi:hypothetical protein
LIFDPVYHLFFLPSLPRRKFAGFPSPGTSCERGQG